MKPITRAAVLGAGTMGSRIAAHLANAGIPTDLLDLPGPPEDVNRLARTGLAAALEQEPPALFLAGYRDRIAIGNFDNDLARLERCDWIIEAVAEDLDIKRRLLARVEPVRRGDGVVSSNTSGIPVAAIARNFSEPFQQHWLGAHFFNPPRYMHLVELIRGPRTLPAVFDWISEICDWRLGKGVVESKDTPGFIANRIAAFSSAAALRLMQEYDFSIEEVDALTGSAIGNPKTATFRTLDLVGLDLAAHVIRDLYNNLPADPRRDWFRIPHFVEQMLAKNWLGEKTGQGFYRTQMKEGRREIWAIDWKTLEYHPRQKPRFASVEIGRNIEDVRQRLPLLLASGDKAAQFLWSLLSEVFLYAASLVGEICESVVEIDRAMRWGYGREVGPFEAWDALGVESVAARLKREKKDVPESVGRMLAGGARSFYQFLDGAAPVRAYFHFRESRYKPVPLRPGILLLEDLKRAQREIKCNAGASLIDLGDGVLCAEFHSKMNTIGEDQVSILMAGLKETAANFEALVVANQGGNFSAGANLVLVLMAAQGGEWDELDAAVRRFQQMNLALKYAPKPVVAAPFGLTLGGGCEIALHCARNQAAAELYMGLVETSVGLIPAGGGTKEFLLRLTCGLEPGEEFDARLQQAFETIGFAKVSTSAEDARGLGFLRLGDAVSMNRDRLVAQAKTAALALAENYQPAAPRNGIPAAGEAGYALLDLGIYLAHRAGQISDYDAVVARKLAYVLSGGRLQGRPLVSEQYLLDLEREAFLSLCGQRQTQERMQHMLKTGKPLRN
jgi:3-hydroxyacyl-CoA dehydrogenase